MSTALNIYLGKTFCPLNGSISLDKVFLFYINLKKGIDFPTISIPSSKAKVHIDIQYENTVKTLF